VPGAPLHEHALLAGGVNKPLLVAAGREFDVDVQPRLDAPGRGRWQELRDRVESRVATAPVDGTHAPQVTREAAAVDQARERELLEQSGAHVVVELLPREVVGEPVRWGDPAES
jgi:hypothetical protein